MRRRGVKRYGFGPRIEIPKAKAVNLRHEVKERTKRNTVLCSLGRKLQEINLILRGWATYYRYCARAGRIFTSIDWYVTDRLWRWMRKKRPKLLNTAAELDATALKSRVFKEVITGDEITGRDLFRSAEPFRPAALHIFASQHAPVFEGGIDRGVQRRVEIVQFNRTIPRGERIRDIGRRICAEEADLLLCWAVEGAQRVIRNGWNYLIGETIERETQKWAQESDVILTYLASHEKDEEWRSSSALFSHFSAWATSAGYKKLPSPIGFGKRLKAAGIQSRHTATGTQFLGISSAPIE